MPDLRGFHVLDGAGHWRQQERREDVNRLLIDFLAGLEPPLEFLHVPTPQRRDDDAFHAPIAALRPSPAIGLLPPMPGAVRRR